MKEALKWFFLSPSKLDVGALHIAAQPFIIYSVLALLIWSTIFAVNDARRRGKSQLLTILFLLSAGWPLSIAWWFWLRPEAPPPAPPLFPLPRPSSRQ